MKRILPLFSLVLFSIPVVAQFGIYATAALIKINSSTSFYNCGTPGNGQDIGGTGFQGAELGTFYQNDGNLVLVGAEIKSFKGANDNVCSGTMYFTVYPKNQRPVSPVFTPIGLGFFSNCTDPVCGSFPNAFPLAKGGGCCNPGDQKWQYPGGGNGGGNSGDIDLTANTTGEYTLEVYYQCSGADNGTGCGTTKYDGNNGNPSNYTAFFSIMPSLPVHFGAVKGISTPQGNRIEWSTLTEQNSSRFIIERSANGAAFLPIGSIGATGNSSVKNQYSFTDEHPLKGVNFYRVQMLETGGAKTYSTVALVNAKTAPGKAFAYPNPAKDIIHLFVPEQNSSIQFYNAAGKLVYSAKMDGQFYSLTVSGWPAGSYYVQMTAPGSQTTLPFVVVK